MQKAGIRRILMSELYQLPAGWEWKKLNELTEVNIGKTPSRSKPEYFFGNNIWLSIRDLKGKYISDSNEKITEEAIRSSNIKVVKKGTLLMSFKLTLGKTSFAECDLYTNEAIASLPIKKEYLLDKYFLDYAIGVIDLEKEVDNAVKGKTLNKEKIKNLDIPLPPLTEQKRIVQKLDALFECIDTAIALLQKNIDAADNFMNSVLNDVFSDLEGQHPKRTLFSFDSGISAGGTPLRQNKLFWENGTIEWFSSGELNQLFTKPANEKITQIGLENSSAKLFEKGTLLIGMYDTAAMKMSILSNDGSCNQAIVGFKPDAKELNIYFAKYQLEYLKPMILEQRQGVRQKNLNLTKIKNIEINYPDLIIQNKVVNFLDEVSAQIEQIKSAQQQKMQNMLDLKSSILDQAFHGKL